MPVHFNEDECRNCPQTCSKEVWMGCDGAQVLFLTLRSRAGRVANDKLRVDDDFAARVVLFAAVANHVVKK